MYILYASPEQNPGSISRKLEAAGDKGQSIKSNKRT